MHEGSRLPAGDVESSAWTSRGVVPNEIAWPLSSRDFQRLGLQFNETRRTVIRRAADRSSRALARRQLDHRDDESSRQLSQVATSAYRLLDPRQRVDNKDRIYVGRILPNALRWAGRTSFSGADGTARERQLPRMDYSDACEDEFIGIESLIDTPATGLDIDVPWKRALDTEDLLLPRVRWMNWFRQQLHRPRALVALTLLLLSVTAWGWSHISSSRTSVTQSQLEREDSGSDTALEPEQLSRRRTERKPSDVRSVESQQVSDFQTTGTSSRQTSGKNVAIPGGPESQTLSNPAEPTSRVAPSRAPSLRPQSQDNSTSELLEDVWDRVDVIEVDGQMNPLGKLVFDYSNSESLRRLGGEVAANTNEPTNQDLQTAPVAKAADTRRPSKAQTAAAEESLAPSLRKLTRLGNREFVNWMQKDLGQLRDEFEPGSAEDWVISCAELKMSWLTDDLQQMVILANQLGERFAVSAEPSLTHSFTEIVKIVSSQREQLEYDQHLLEQTPVIVDRLIVTQQWEQADELLSAVVELLGRGTTHQMAPTMTAYKETLKTARRYADSLSGVLDRDIASVNVSEAESAGRFCCLILRDWETGLPWMAKGEQPRLAILARRELELSSQDTDEVIALASAWLAVAERSSGFSADALRLHAVSLMHNADDKKRSVAGLTLRRRLGSTLKELPEPLVQRFHSCQHFDQLVVFRELAPANPSPATTVAWNGRLRANGKDTGIELNFGANVNLDQELILRAQQAITHPVDDWKIELASKLTVQTDQLLVIEISQTDTVRCKFSINEQVISFREGQTSIVVPISGGTHALSCEYETAILSELSFRLSTVDDGQSLGIQPAYSRRSGDVPTVLTLRGTHGPR